MKLMKGTWKNCSVFALWSAMKARHRPFTVRYLG